MFYLFSGFLNLDIKEIGLHILNLIILILALRFLLYNPIKKFIDKREKQYKDLDTQTKENNQKSQEQKEKYEKLVEQTKGEVAKISKETAERTNLEVEKILNEAKAEANKIIENAKNNAKEMQNNCKLQMAKKSSELAISISEKILEREISNRDLDTIIDECLDVWS